MEAFLGNAYDAANGAAARMLAWMGVDPPDTPTGQQRHKIQDEGGDARQQNGDYIVLASNKADDGEESTGKGRKTKQPEYIRLAPPVYDFPPELPRQLIPTDYYEDRQLALVA